MNNSNDSGELERIFIVNEPLNVYSEVCNNISIRWFRKKNTKIGTDGKF